MDYDISRIGFDNSSHLLSYENIINDILLVSRKYGLCKYFLVKGGVALTRILKDTPNVDLTTRLTIDLDLHWFLQYKSKWEYFVDNIVNILNSETIYGFNYEFLNRRGYTKNPNGDSIKLQVSQQNCPKMLKFKIDMNLGENIDKVIRYDEGDVGMYPMEYILADKLCVITTRTVYRRCKDLIDVYNLTYYKNFNYTNLVETMQEKRDIKSLTLDFILYEFDKDNINKAYDSLTRIKFKPDLTVILQRVMNFIIPIVTKGEPVSTWDINRGAWI